MKHRPDLDVSVTSRIGRRSSSRIFVLAQWLNGLERLLVAIGETFRPCIWNTDAQREDTALGLAELSKQGAESLRVDLLSRKFGPSSS